MRITKRQLRKIIKEEIAHTESVISERGTGNPAFQAEERALMDAAVDFQDKYMMAMGMNPGDPADAQRTRRVINDIIGTILGI